MVKQSEQRHIMLLSFYQHLINRKKGYRVKVIKASGEEIYQAIIDPHALACWVPPENMQDQINQFELWKGGRYQITLGYDHPEDREKFGKSSDGRYHAREILKTGVRQMRVPIGRICVRKPGLCGSMIMTYEVKVMISRHW